MMHPGFIWTEVAVLAIAGVIPPTDAFVFHIQRIGLHQPPCRSDYDSKYHIHVPASTGQSCPLASAVRTFRPSISVKMSSADGSIQHQFTSSLEASKGLEEADTRSIDQSNPSLTPVAPHDRVSTRTGMALDGTPLLFRRPTTEEMHKLGMGNWVAQKGLALALIAIHEEDVGVCAPLAGAVVESVDGAGGSSVATRVYMLRHWDSDGVSASVQHALLDEAITQFLNDGARIGQLRVEVDGSHKSLDFYSRHGFVRSSTDGTPLSEGQVAVLSGDREAGLRAIRALPQEGASIGAVGMNLMGRLLHDVGDLEGAVNAYLKALEIDPSRSEVFRGLGGAYQSQRQHQMAFASYQQAINLAPTDLLTYLKVGMLYEELAVGKYEEAGDHAIRCFDYYLQHSGSDDTDVLTRLGNLQVRRLDPSSAIKTYERALAVDPSLANVWFNLANAYLQLGQEQEASRCLHEKLRLDPDSGVTTKYLLASLESQPERLTEEDQTAYARELFDYYASTYDDHTREKLLYTGPRLLRKNVKDVYNKTFGSLPEEIRSGHNNDVLSYLNGSLDILDLGCGTGLIGSWFKDYARTLVGVDVSPMMLDMATKKGCYHELRRGDIRRYLAASAEEVFDLVVAAETLQYIGPLEGVFGDAFRVLRVGGYFAFTVDRLIEDEEEDDHSREKAEDESEGGAPRQCQTSGASARFSLKTDGTYAYNRAYLEALALRNNFDIIVLKTHSSLIQKGVAAPGYMGILRKGTSKESVSK